LLERTDASPNALLFPAAKGNNLHLRHDVFMNSWRRALKKSGISDGAFSPHGLRHFAGSHLHLAGATIAELKEWLGDSSTAAVMRYVHSTGRTANIADKMLELDELRDVG
jgi:integrase